MTPPIVRWMIRRDMPEVLAIDDEAYDRPWCEDDFLGCLKTTNGIGMVADDGNRIVGFMVYELHKTRLSILRFAVRPSMTRQGIGTRMMGKLVTKLSQQRRSELWFEVGERCLDGQLFLRAMGFRHAQTFHRDGADDVYLMKFRHGQDAIRAEDAGWVAQAFGGVA